jgi:transcription initiation factor TFIIIB Brf1 subunit/transcription initiation factor TFIIB
MSNTRELEADLEETRQHLGETIDALGEKLDVKAHVKSSADQAKDRAVETVSSNWREIAVVAAWAALVTIVWKRF